ncbi:MAG TPA: glycosyltransferase family 2 protein [Opitutaceae bacterium]|nr:glycosyltransferase family 2 protein [Opitutaceae bacterium]
MTAADPFLPALAVVVPFFNEEAAAGAVVDELCRELVALGLEWEAVLVNDGSTDGTGAALTQACARWPRCRVVHLPENGGQGPALRCGISETGAPLIAIMDGDGQNVPADLGVLLAALDRADLVVGARTPRHDSWLRRRMSRVANTVRGWILRDGVTDAACALKVFRRELMATFPAAPAYMFHPYLPALALAAGYRVAERPVRHRPRRSGRSKYGLRVMLCRPLLDTLAVGWRLRHRRAEPARGAARSQT